MSDLSHRPEYGRLLAETPGAQELVARAQDFTRRYIDPVAYELDQALLLDPNKASEEIVKRGCEYGFLSLPIPAFLGGGGRTILDCAILLEVLSAGCAGISNIFGAHYLGLSGIMLGLDVNHFDRFFREVADSEKRGVPVLFSAAVTEPMAGSDVEDREFLPQAKLVTFARKVDGGYLLNGRKVFISNGSVARYQTIICALDKDQPLETWSGFTVPTSSPGFTVARVELKMGQRACHAAEIVFEDCFVPRENRIGLEGHGMRVTEMVLAASRAPVGAIATGIAQGALTKTIEFARRKRAGKGILTDKQWVQLALADMEAQVQAARASYFAAGRLFDHYITSALMGNKHLLGAFMRLSQPLRTSRLGKRFTGSNGMRRWSARLSEKRLDKQACNVALGLASLSKVTCSDIAVNVCQRALEVLGDEGAEERGRVEKYVRDAKLTQIYEGTNQINRLVGFKMLLKGERR